MVQPASATSGRVLALMISGRVTERLCSCDFNRLTAPAARGVPQPNNSLAARAVQVGWELSTDLRQQTGGAEDCLNGLNGFGCSWAAAAAVGRCDYGSLGDQSPG